MSLVDELDSDHFQCSSFLEAHNLPGQMLIERLNTRLEPSSTFATIEGIICQSEKGQLEITLSNQLQAENITGPCFLPCPVLSRSGPGLVRGSLVPITTKRAFGQIKTESTQKNTTPEPTGSRRVLFGA